MQCSCGGQTTERESINGRYKHCTSCGRTLTANEKARQTIEEQIAIFFKEGKEVTHVPFGVSSETAKAERADSSRVRWTKDTNHKTVFTKNNMRGKQ